ncbi:MAG: RagB/SusD family nutrient uptake outer membrane protein [Gemmatimonadaceae bacterium]
MTRCRPAGFVIALLAATGCTENLVVDPTSTITVNSFWKSPEDARGALAGMYVRFRGEAGLNLYVWGGSRSEELTTGVEASEGRERFFLNTLDATNAGPDWLRLYTVVHDANLILKYVPRVTFVSENEPKEILAQAYAMRAYAYFIMARTWGGVPIVKEPTESYDPVGSLRPRDDVARVFELIKQDADSALALFPTSTFPACRCQWSRPAVNALKGDVHLWTAKRRGGGAADFTTALQALQSAAAADVTLLPRVADVFAYTSKGNREILMAVRHQDLESGENWGNTMYIRDDQIGAVNASARALVGTGGGASRWTPSPTLRQQFTFDDSRRDATFAELFRMRGADSTFYAAVALKYKGFVTSGSRRFMDDVVLYRHADVLLMIAEAKNGLGQDPSSEMNAVRQRAYGASFPSHRFTSAGQQQNDALILKERLLELALEGKRWWDLVRFGKAFELAPSLQTRASQAHLLLWPISQTTISLDPKVTQNPGY